MEPLFALVGNSKDGTVTTLRVADGALTEVATTSVAPGLPLAVDRARSLVYAGTSDPRGVSVLRLLPTGALEPVGSYPAHGASVYLTLSSDGGLLFSASYHDHLGEVWRVTEDGVLTPVGGPILRQNMHSVQLSADDRFAYFVSLGDDLVVQSALAADGTLTPLDPPVVAAPKGAGARHLVLAADERSAYLMTEFTGQAIRYLRDEAGTLTGVEAVDAFDPDAGLTVSRRGADPRAEGLIWGSDVHLARGGAWLLCSERSASTIAAVRLGAGGSLGGELVLSPTEQQPRGFAVTPDGRGVIVAGEASGHVSYSEVNADGTLTLKGRYASGAGANWVRFA